MRAEQDETSASQRPPRDARRPRYGSRWTRSGCASTRMDRVRPLTALRRKHVSVERKRMSRPATPRTPRGLRSQSRGALRVLTYAPPPRGAPSARPPWTSSPICPRRRPAKRSRRITSRLAFVALPLALLIGASPAPSICFGNHRRRDRQRARVLIAQPLAPASPSGLQGAVERPRRTTIGVGVGARALARKGGRWAPRRRWRCGGGALRGRHNMTGRK